LPVAKKNVSLILVISHQGRRIFDPLFRLHFTASLEKQARNVVEDFEKIAASSPV
jgi:hypothetical protein